MAGLTALVAVPAVGAAHRKAGSDSARVAAAERLILAQRWTPLTGPLNHDDDKKKKSPSKDDDADDDGTAPPPKKPKPAKPAPKASSGDGPEGRIRTLEVTLGKMTTDGETHGSLGITSTAVDRDLARAVDLDETDGALITSVTEDGPGATAGMLSGDIVQTLDGGRVTSGEDLVDKLRALSPGRSVQLGIWRAGNGPDDFRSLLEDRAASEPAAAAVLAKFRFLGQVLSKDTKEAARLFLKAAEGGHVASMQSYALMRKDGVGVARDDKDAARWFLKAAEAGNEPAMTNLGILYETGRGAGKDAAEAARWYQKGTDVGNGNATYRLGLLYEAGNGVKKDIDEAIRLLKSASDKGISEASIKLADIYEGGRGVEKDQDEADRWRRTAADQVRKAGDNGNAVALFNLGILFRTGRGVKRDDSEAGYWIVRAFKRGDEYLANELLRNPNVLVLEDRKWIQRLLKDEGVYSGSINGRFDETTRKAMLDLGGKS